jgi:hypothetical protein
MKLTLRYGQWLLQSRLVKAVIRRCLELVDGVQFVILSRLLYDMSEMEFIVCVQFLL